MVLLGNTVADFPLFELESVVTLVTFVYVFTHTT